MPYLPWINNNDLIEAVTFLLDKAKAAKKSSKSKFKKNVIDPFSAIFEMAGFEINYDQWIVSEEARKAQKTLQNHVGEFHQRILGSCNGWTNMKSGKIIDIHNPTAKIIAEIKNKHNTIPGGDLSNLYKSLHRLVMPNVSNYKGYTAYYVSIIPKNYNRYENEFTPSDKANSTQCAKNALIKQIDGASFYEKVTGIPTALEDLFDILPQVISDITQIPAVETDKVKLIFDWAYAEPVKVVKVKKNKVPKPVRLKAPKKSNKGL